MQSADEYTMPTAHLWACAASTRACKLSPLGPLPALTIPHMSTGDVSVPTCISRSFSLPCRWLLLLLLRLLHLLAVARDPQLSPGGMLARLSTLPSRPLEACWPRRPRVDAPRLLGRAGLSPPCSTCRMRLWPGPLDSGVWCMQGSETLARSSWKSAASPAICACNACVGHTATQSQELAGSAHTLKGNVTLCYC